MAKKNNNKTKKRTKMKGKGAMLSTMRNKKNSPKKNNFISRLTFSIKGT